MSNAGAGSRTWPPLAGVLIAALAARAAYLAGYLRSPLHGFFRIDQMYYREWALRIAAGDLRGQGPFEQGPLYAYLLGGLYRLFGPRDTWVIALQFGCGLATAALVWSCARRLFGGPAGLAAGILAALYGPFLVHEGMIMKSFLEPLLVALALWAGLRALEGGRAGWALLAGLAVGLACLVREAHVLLLLPLAAALRGPAARGRLLALAAGVLIPVAPVTARNCLVAGECAPVTTGGGEVFYLAFGPDATGFYAVPDFVRPFARLEHEDFREEARLRAGRFLSRGEASDFWFREGLRAVGKAPGRAASLVVRKAAVLFNDFEVPDSENAAVMKEHLPLLRVLPGFGGIFGLGLVGIGLSGGLRNRAGLALGFVAALVLQVLLTYNFARFRLALAAVWLIFCGHALAAIAAAWRRGRAGRRGALAACALAAGASATAFVGPPGLEPARRAGEQSDYREHLRRAAGARDELPALRRAAAETPGDAAAHAALARALQETGRIADAIEAWRGALHAHPGDGEAFREYTFLLRWVGRGDEAEAAVREFARANPGSPDVPRAMAMILEERASAAPPARVAEAVARARAALVGIIRTSPGDAEALYRYGRLSYLAGEREEGRRALTAALAIAPEHPGAARVLAHLEERNE